MAIALTWRNVYVMVGLMAMIVSLMLGGVGAMIQWRFVALQYQLDDRLTAYHRDILNIEKRLDNIEKRLEQR